jgi:hypothetical protein
MWETHMFWAYGDLSKLERFCIETFLRRGYVLNLWSYGAIGNVPAGARLRDARDLSPEEIVFLNAKGSYASFSDIFRYAVVSELGGMWADTDVAAVVHAKELPEEAFLVSECVHQHVQINNNLIFNPAPTKGDLIDLARAYSRAYPRNRIEWSEIGPDLLTALVSIIPDHGYRIMTPDFANPISSHACPARLLDPSFAFDRPPAFVHLYNERWRMTGTDKNQVFPQGCVMDLLENNLPLKIGALSTPSNDRKLFIRKARLSAEIYPPTLIRRIAELFSTLGKWSGLRSFRRFADSLWQAGVRLAFLIQNDIK